MSLWPVGRRGCRWFPRVLTVRSVGMSYLGGRTSRLSATSHFGLAARHVGTHFAALRRARVPLWCSLGRAHFSLRRRVGYPLVVLDRLVLCRDCELGPEPLVDPRSPCPADRGCRLLDASCKWRRGLGRRCAGCCSCTLPLGIRHRLRKITGHRSDGLR